MIFSQRWSSKVLGWSGGIPVVVVNSAMSRLWYRCRTDDRCGKSCNPVWGGGVSNCGGRLSAYLHNQTVKPNQDEPTQADGYAGHVTQEE